MRRASDFWKRVLGMDTHISSGIILFRSIVATARSPYGNGRVYGGSASAEGAAARCRGCFVGSS